MSKGALDIKNPTLAAAILRRLGAAERSVATLQRLLEAQKRRVDSQQRVIEHLERSLHRQQPVEQLCQDANTLIPLDIGKQAPSMSRGVRTRFRFLNFLRRQPRGCTAAPTRSADDCQ